MALNPGNISTDMAIEMANTWLESSFSGIVCIAGPPLGFGLSDVGVCIADRQAANALNLLRLKQIQLSAAAP